MRLNHLSIPLLAVASTSLAYQAQEPFQIYLYPTPSDASPLASAPTLTAAQAKAVLSHHLGEAIGDFEEIPSDEGLWSHLLHMWSGDHRGHGLSQASGSGRTKAKVVIIEGGVTAQDVLPTSLPTSPSFYLEDGSSTSSLLAPYLRSASNLLDHILESLPEWTKSSKDTFELAGTRAATALGHELECLTAMADSIPWLDSVKHSSTWEAISIHGLSHVNKQDEVWEEGRKGVQAGLAAMTTPDSPPLLLIIRPSTSPRLYARALPPILKARQEAGNTTMSCYASEDDCKSATSCNGRGSCALQSKTDNGECWGCKCSSGYAGTTCQKNDYSTPFILIVFSTLLLSILAIGSVALLYTVGETKLPSTLNLAVGGSIKRD
ncbi:hypothetical protein BD324DRAFT_642285 [Kockovaella imperatae]|uniref:EGF-like domain-containing protein n=1 Tax=Kockovaella imperatae TaxID=4999 RepID=A0A1Y1UHQ1_9TREE|nr:hypothetical protein BD324DRAFT_642285 [Kockovaella imperatae]ORX36615.1 hypothetical protein BD324DRAFT_642285 [Kockovaella imperatae]